MKSAWWLCLTVLGLMAPLPGCNDDTGVAGSGGAAGSGGSSGSGGAAGTGGRAGSGGAGGIVDECPDDPDKASPGVCGCGVPDDDRDKDTVVDCEDDCIYDLSGVAVAGRNGAGVCQCDGFCGPFYEVRRIAAGGTAPTIDGVADGGEWNASNVLTAAPYGQLRATGSEPFGYRFRMLWDDMGLYILLESDFAFHPPPSDRETTPDFSGNDAVNHNLYFDPTFEFSGDPGQPVGTPDGYQISWDVTSGRATRFDGVRGDPMSDVTVDYLPGMLLEAHVGQEFGDNAPWLDPGLISCANYRDCFAPGLAFAQVADNAGLLSGGTLASELFFEWSVFTAPGLEHTDPPLNGERWKFEHAVINVEGPGGATAEGFLPSWSDPQSSTARISFATWPHGTIVFVE